MEVPRIWNFADHLFVHFLEDQTDSSNEYWHLYLYISVVLHFVLHLKSKLVRNNFFFNLHKLAAVTAALLKCKQSSLLFCQTFCLSDSHTFTRHSSLMNGQHNNTLKCKRKLSLLCKTCQQQHTHERKIPCKPGNSSNGTSCNILSPCFLQCCTYSSCSPEAKHIPS
jgi:hypothetical protein